MERLKGKTLLIGKEPGKDKLIVYFPDVNKAALVEGCTGVPTSVSRCLPNAGKAHAEISVSDNGSVFVKNLKEENVTYVNGSPILSKKVDPRGSVQLGGDRYNVSLPAVFSSALKLLPQGEATFSVAHLEAVWEKFHQGSLDMRKDQKKRAMLWRAPMFIGVLSSMVSALGAGMHWGENMVVVSGAFAVLSFVTMGYMLFKESKDDSVEKLDELQTEFQENYVCPNPECGRFLGNFSYKMMLNQYHKQCPYCKCRFKE